MWVGVLSTSYVFCDRGYADLLRSGLIEGQSTGMGRGSKFTRGFLYTLFEERLFDHPNNGGNATDRLHRLKQGAWSVSDFAVEFWTGC